MKKNIKSFYGLMIANTEVNLLICIQIRRKFFGEFPMDIILGNKRVLYAYENGNIGKFFDEVFYYDYEEYKYSISKFWSARRNLLNTIGTDAKKYSDIFFWNPDCFLYNIFHQDVFKNKKYHLYSDSVAIFLDLPRFDKHYWGISGKILNAIDYYIFGWGRWNRFRHDIYSFRVDLIEEGKYPNDIIIEIPQCTKEDIEAFNQAYNYNKESNDIKIIFLDVAHNGEFDEDLLTDKVNELMNSELGYEMRIKPHPGKIRQNYIDKGYRLLDIGIPWELFCLNEDMNNIILIGVYGGSIIQTYIMSGQRFKAVLLDNIIPSKFKYYKEIKRLFELVNNETHQMIEVNSFDEINDSMNILLRDDKELIYWKENQ